MPQDINHGLGPLESLWVWARAYSELRGIYALHETFRRFQVQQTKQGRVPSPRQAWIDLTEAILYDPKNAVNASIGRMHELIQKEKLFELALKVTRQRKTFRGSQASSGTWGAMYRTRLTRDSFYVNVRKGSKRKKTL